jgi:maleate isomerase
VNFDFAGVEPDTLLDRMFSMVSARPEAFVTYCTNLRAAQLAQYVEEHWGIPLLDTVSTTIWGMLRMAGADSGGIKGWGVLYECR